MPDTQELTYWEFVRGEIGQFRKAREGAAELNFRIQQLERDRTALRKTIAEDLVEQGLSKTKAADEARVDSQYVEASRLIEKTTQEWECALAYAEEKRLMVQTYLGEAEEKGGRDSAAVELKRMGTACMRRVKQLGG